MDNAGYIGLSRNAGLSRELTTIANNIANINTNGFRREGAVFAEHVRALDNNDPSLSIATMTRRYVDLNPGDIAATGNPLDFAIEGDGFFLVETPSGERLTRDGAFSLNQEGELVTSSGARVLDDAGGAIAIPQGATDINAANDGAIFVDGQQIGRLNIVNADPAFLTRDGDNAFLAENGFEAVENPLVRQNALEGSNVNPVAELARLIEVQRTYDSSRNLMQQEDERIKRTVQTLGQT